MVGSLFKIVSEFQELVLIAELIVYSFKMEKKKKSCFGTNF